MKKFRIVAFMVIFVLLGGITNRLWSQDDEPIAHDIQGLLKQLEKESENMKNLNAKIGEQENKIVTEHPEIAKLKSDAAAAKKKSVDYFNGNNNKFPDPSPELTSARATQKDLDAQANDAMKKVGDAFKGVNNADYNLLIESRILLRNKVESIKSKMRIQLLIKGIDCKVINEDCLNRLYDGTVPRNPIMVEEDFFREGYENGARYFRTINGINGNGVTFLNLYKMKEETMESKNKREMYLFKIRTENPNASSDQISRLMDDFNKANPPVISTTTLFTPPPARKPIVTPVPSPVQTLPDPSYLDIFESKMEKLSKPLIESLQLMIEGKKQKQKSIAAAVRG